MTLSSQLEEETNRLLSNQKFDIIVANETKARIRQDRMKSQQDSNMQAKAAGRDYAEFNIPYYEWTMKFRKKIEGHDNIVQYFPLMRLYYEDLHPRKAAVFARQRGKSTDAAGRLAYIGTQKHTKGLYITFSDHSLSIFSGDKFRNSVLSSDNPEIFEVVKGADRGKGSVHRVEYLTGSSTSLVTHANKMHHAEGPSPDLTVLDECQNLDLISYFKAKEAHSWTHGSELFIGVGGYLNTEWHKLYLSGDQREWKYDNPNWYEDMLANPLFWNDKGFVWRSELNEVLKGKWVPRAPQNSDVLHSYTIGQDLFPNVPRTMKDAKEKFKISVTESLEFKKRDYPSLFYKMHVEAGFVKGDTVPFNKEAIFRIMDKASGFTKPQDVDRTKGKIYATADWGGGSSAFTIPLIAQCIHPTAPLFKVLYIARVDEPDVEKQADQFINLCNAYEVDAIGIDAGGGARQVQKVLQKFGPRCTPISYIQRPDPPMPTDAEMQKIRKENRYFIDRTYSLQRLKDLIDKPLIQGSYAFPRIIIPGADLDKVAWIAEDFAAVQGEMIKISKSGQDYIKYDHDPMTPDDAVHAFNYLWITQMLDHGSDIWIKSF